MSSLACGIYFNFVEEYFHFSRGYFHFRDESICLVLTHSFGRGSAGWVCLLGIAPLGFAQRVLGYPGPIMKVNSRDALKLAGGSHGVISSSKEESIFLKDSRCCALGTHCGFHAEASFGPGISWPMMSTEMPTVRPFPFSISGAKTLSELHCR